MPVTTIIAVRTVETITYPSGLMEEIVGVLRIVKRTIEADFDAYEWIREHAEDCAGFEQADGDGLEWILRLYYSREPGKTSMLKRHYIINFSPYGDESCVNILN